MAYTLYGHALIHPTYTLSGMVSAL